MTTLKAPRVPEQRDFPSRLHHPSVAARVGAWLGICFFVAFATGVISHLAQQPDSWLPSRPVWGYRLTQGLHVAAGTACVPLLLVKLWTVYPRFWIRPPRPRRDLLLHAAERASVGVLVAAAVFQLATGLANVTTWYPWSFSFRPTHFAVAWVVTGALVVHIAVKLPVVREALATSADEDEPAGDGLSRRSLVRTAGVASAAAVLLTAGGTVPWLRKVSVFSARSGEGPQDVPVNKSARAAGVTATATDPAYRLEIAYADRSTSLSRDDLLAMTQRTVGPADRVRRGLERPRRVVGGPAPRPARPRRRAPRVDGHRLVAPGAGTVPRDPSAGPVRRRRPHPARPRPRRRGALDRPRLPRAG